MLAVIAVVLIECLSDSVSEGRDVRHKLGVATLGAVVSTRKDRRNPIRPAFITAMDPYSPTAEAYRVIRVNTLSASSASMPVVYTVTSAQRGDGKTTTSCNLAISFAQGGCRTILVDADLRQSAMHRIFGCPNEGLGRLFGSGPTLGAAMSDVVRPNEVEQLSEAIRGRLVQSDFVGLQVLPAGPALPINPAELLSSPRARAILSLLEEMADVVILDAPPVLAVADAMILAACATGVIFVVDARKTRGHQAKQACEALTQAGASVLGVVLNRASRSSSCQGYGPYGDPKRDRGPIADSTPSNGRKPFSTAGRASPTRESNASV
jgi:capsular exopolysaccharide synthesis family protein